MPAVLPVLLHIGHDCTVLKGEGRVDQFGVIAVERDELKVRFAFLLGLQDAGAEVKGHQLLDPGDHLVHDLAELETAVQAGADLVQGAEVVGPGLQIDATAGSSR